jgi:glycosyltransferase involved in cell wall biosynthesis
MAPTSQASSKYNVHIFMAVLNGERWLTPQIDSILNQTNVSCTWSITDDASNDNSVSILKAKIPQERITLTLSKDRVGLPNVFLNMLKNPPAKHDFYAFADQDDCWFPEKLDRACKEISTVSQDQPALWVSSISMISKGKPVRKVPTKQPSLGHALVESLAPGCTMVWNAAFQEQLVIPDATKCKMHDTWIYLSACILGTVIVESQPMVDYRIHEDNAVGHSNDLISRTRRFVSEVLGNRVSMEMQAQAILESYANALTPSDKELVEAIARGSRFTRIRYWIRHKIRMEDGFDNLLLIARLLIVPKSTRNTQVSQVINKRKVLPSTKNSAIDAQDAPSRRNLTTDGESAASVAPKS